MGYHTEIGCKAGSFPSPRVPYDPGQFLEYVYLFIVNYVPYFTGLKSEV